jgi:hypothetical protein
MKGENMKKETTGPSAIPGFNVMLCGGTGTGKTYSIRTLLEAGLEVFVLFTEPGMETLADTNPKQLHWHYCPAVGTTFAELRKSAGMINKLSFKSLAQLDDIQKSSHVEMLQLMDTCCNFVDDRTGEAFGDVGQWDTSRVLVLDSLSGLNVMAMNLVTGSKPVKAVGEWGVAMDNLLRLINLFTLGCSCHFVLITHLERQVDEMTGQTNLMAATLGRKLAPQLPIYMSDVILSRRKGTEFSWSTAAHGIDLKARNVPLSDKITPSFAPLYKFWKEKQHV